MSWPNPAPELLARLGDLPPPLRHPSRVVVALPYLTVIRPHPRLASRVTAFLAFHGHRVPPSLRVWPGGRAAVWMHFGAQPHSVEIDREWVRSPLVAHGPLDQMADVRFRGRVDSMQVLFQLGGTQGVFRTGLGELGTGCPGVDVLSGLLAQTFESLAALTLVERIHRLEAILERCFAGSEEPPTWVRSGIDLVRRRGGRITTAELVASLNYSPVHIRRAFRNSTGLAPMQLARRRRFIEVRRRIERAPGGNLLGLAERYGFYDQSHLARDFHALASMSPGDFIDSLESDLVPKERWNLLDALHR